MDIYGENLNRAFNKEILDHKLKRIKIDNKDSNFKIENLNKLNNSIDSNRINRNKRKKFLLEAKNLIKSIETESFKKLIKDQINLNDIIDELPIDKLDNFIMNKLKDSQVSELNKLSIDTNKSSTEIINESPINTNRPSTEIVNESSTEIVNESSTEIVNESSTEIVNESSTEIVNESSINTNKPSTKKSIDTVSKSPKKKFKKFKRDNVEKSNDKIDQLNENMMVDQLTDSSSNQNENMNHLTALKKLIDNSNKNKIDNLSIDKNLIESNNLKSDSIQSNNSSTLNLNIDLIKLTNPMESKDINQLDYNSTDNLNENIINSNRSYGDSTELNFSINTIESDNLKDHSKSNSIENLSTSDNSFKETNLNTVKNLLNNQNEENNLSELNNFASGSFIVVDQFQADEKSVSSSDQINEDSSIKNTSNNKCNLFTDLFTRLKINNQILKSIELLNLKNNEVSFNQQKEISEFLFNNKDTNLFIRTKPFHKKLSYLVYVLNRINTNHSYTQAIIITSTVELSYQIKSLIKLLVKFRSDISLKILSSDVDYYEKMKHHLICCTSGTLTHCINKGLLDLYRVKLCIFEEFDVLNSVKSDRGVEDNTSHFQRLLNNFNYDCQQIYFSTNLDSSSLKSAKSLTKNKLKTLNLLDESMDLFDNILNFYIICADKTIKYDNLIKLFKNMTFKKIVIFSNGKGHPIYLKEKLDEDIERYKLDLKVALLTGSCQIDYRLKSLKEFKKNKRNVLIVTYPINVGLEFGDVDLVINYDMTFYENRFLYREFFNKTIYLNRFKPNITFSITFLPSTEKNAIAKLSEKFNIKMYKLDLFSK